MDPVTFTPIGVVRTPFHERARAPRQPSAEHPAEGVIELVPGRGFEHALEDLAGWEIIWVLFCFHKNEGWRSKVLPPRSTERRGVFATRSPYRPNPIGMSAVELVRVDGLSVHVRGVDMLDGSPVLDIKPYVAYADARPDARAGWLEVEDPKKAHSIAFSARAREQLDFLSSLGVDLEEPLTRALRLGPEPHPYRRIKRDGDALRIAIKEWRARFTVEGDTITVGSIHSGYSERDLAGDAAELAPHRRFVERFRT